VAISRLWALPLLGLASCAFNNITVVPPEPVPVSTVSGGNQRMIHVVAPLADERPSKARCGMKKNSYNMDTAAVHCSAAPSSWVADLLVHELEAAGFQIATEPSPSPDAVTLEGQLLQFFIEPDIGFWSITGEADVYVRLVASTPSGLLAERDFFVKGEESSALFGTDGLLQAAANDGVRRIVTEMTAAVVELMDLYPELGAAPTPTNPAS
jgi:hypothetical protein